MSLNRLVQITVPEHMHQELCWWSEVLDLDVELTARLVLTAGLKAIKPLTEDTEETK